MTQFAIGCELGKSHMNDYSTLAVIERLTPAAAPEPDKAPATLHCRHLHRYPLGTRYPALIEHLQGVLQTEPLQGNSTLIVNITEAGQPVTNLLWDADIRHRAAIITGGQEVAYGNGMEKIPKRVLVSTLQVLLQGQRLKFASELPESGTLVSELLNFQLTARESEADLYEGRQGPQADLVLSTALACYQAERPLFRAVAG